MININAPKPISINQMKRYIVLTCLKYTEKKIYIYKKHIRLIPENIKMNIESEEQLNTFFIKYFIPEGIQHLYGISK